MTLPHGLRFLRRLATAHRGRATSALARLSAGLCAIILVLQATTADAQQYERRRNLFDMLFGGPRYDDRYAPPPPRYDRRPRDDDNGSITDVRPRKPRTRAPAVTPTPRDAEPSAPAPEAVAKLPDARRILVVGDFFAGNLGDALGDTFATSPGVDIVSRSDGSSGLVRDDHYDWLAALPKMLDEVKPSIVVIMLGANDRQQIDLAGGKEKFRSDAWFTAYDSRVDQLAGLVTARKLPLLWVGLPSFQSPSLSADAVTLNTLYKEHVEKAGGEFVDVWDGFVDEDGKFIVSGSDVNGQQVRLRSADGVAFTKAGKQKLAFYVERVLRRHLGEMGAPDIANLGSGQLPQLNMNLSGPDPNAPSLPISMVDPSLDGGTDLLGGTPPAPAPANSPRDVLVKNGELPTAPAGRVDDYRIRKASGE